MSTLRKTSIAVIRRAVTYRMSQRPLLCAGLHLGQETSPVLDEKPEPVAGTLTHTIEQG
jgi:hypothetical protein